MKLNTLKNLVQTSIGLITISLAVVIFANVNNYLLAPVEQQLFVIWNVLFLILVMYGSFQLMSGLIEIYFTRKEE
jgi:hypothetical protein